MPLKPEDLRAAGDWVVQLKVILGKGTDFGGRPGKEHRSTKKAVKLLLTNLRLGVGGDRQKYEDTNQRQRAEKLVLNAVDQLIDDKTSKSKKGKTRLEALKKFEEVLQAEFKDEKQKGGMDVQWKHLIDDAINGLRYEEIEKGYRAGSISAEEMLDDKVLTARHHLRHEIVNAVDPTKLTGEKKELWLQRAESSFIEGAISAEDMAGTERGRMLLEKNPKLRGKVVALLDPAKLDEFLNRFPDKSDVAAGALQAIAGKAVAPSGAVPDRKKQLDPAAFTRLKAQFTAADWNDKTRGLGPRVCQALWKTGNYDQIVELIQHGVDTSLPARFPGLSDPDAGIYSGFCQPVEHIVQKHLHDVSLLDQDPCPLDGDKLIQAKGAKKILAALKAAGAAKTVTDWKDVTSSELIQEFKKNPGTIWGFEDVRLPFVQAAHGTKQGVQPVRMMELWEAVEQATQKPEAYEELLTNPDSAADKFVAIGVAKIEAGLKSGDAKYAEIARDKDAYIRRFKRQAKSFLLEYAAQMPKTTYITPSIAGPGKAAVPLSDLAGIQPGKLGGGLACKAGLWWAKEEKKPVYYCLDGIDMDDVINYKKAKNKAIDDFIAAGGKAGVKGHDEVITMVELREVLKNWDDLKGTVKFVLKGKILADDGVANELTTKVQDWQAKMKAANKAAGRATAPPRDKFANNLNAIDPGLMARLADGPEGDMDARDIVKKSSYLVKVAKTRPLIVLKYIISRCEVLTRYGLLSSGLAGAAAKLVSPKVGDDIPALKAQLLLEINKCNAKFQAPLRAALTR
jgi:hypothetical protein